MICTYSAYWGRFLNLLANDFTEFINVIKQHFVVSHVSLQTVAGQVGLSWGKFITCHSLAVATDATAIHSH